MLRDSGRIGSDAEKVADMFNMCFMNIICTLKIDWSKQFLFKTNDKFDPVLKAIKKFNVNPSILSITE